MDFSKVKLIPVIASSFWNGGSYEESGNAVLNPVTGEVSNWSLDADPNDASDDDREAGIVLDGNYIEVGTGPTSIELKLNRRADMVEPDHRWKLAQFMTPEFCSVLDVETAADTLQWPLAEWAGQCFAVASQLVKAHRLPGDAVYGMFVGKIAKNSHFSQRQHGFTQHGWIRMKSGVLIDPTRWVFEAVTPYIFVTMDTAHPDYDEGANTMLELSQKFRKAFGLVKKGNDLVVPKALQAAVGKLLEGAPRPHVSTSELFAVANTPLGQLGPQAKPIYKWLINAGHSALIPYDNRNRVMDP